MPVAAGIGASWRPSVAPIAAFSTSLDDHTPAQDCGSEPNFKLIGAAGGSVAARYLRPVGVDQNRFRVTDDGILVNDDFGHIVHTG